MSVIVIVIAAVVLLGVMCGLALWWDSARQRGGSAVTSMPFNSRRRAVAATLEMATAQLPASALTLRPSEEGNFIDRIINPLASVIASFTRRISPPGYVDSVQRRLTIAGADRRADYDRFLAGRLATVTLIPVGFMLVQLSSLPKFYKLLAFLFVTITLVLGPEASLNRRAEARQDKIRRELPSLVDLLMISVEAGLGFDQALTRAVISLPGALSEEFGRFLGEVRMGGERTESLEAIDLRTDVPELR
jgi:tight adherence protein C